MIFNNHENIRRKTVEEAKNILSYNRKRIYKLLNTTRKYPSLRIAIEPVIQDLLDITAYWLKHDCISYGTHSMVYFLSTHNGTYKVRKKTTKGVTNRHINYLCALGLLKKLEQTILYGYSNGYARRYMTKYRISGVNRNLLRYDRNSEKEPMNTFEVFKYTTEVLEECDKMAERLLSAKITAGNISYNQLALNGLKDIADKIYIKDRTESAKKKEREYEELVSCIQYLINIKGYTTKQEIYDNCLIDDVELDKLFKIFKNDLWKNWDYKAPTKDDKEKFNLSDGKWIITAKQTG